MYQEPSKSRWERVPEFFREQWRKVAIGATAVLVILGVTIGVWALWFRTHDEGATIAGFNWHRKMEVIDYQPRQKQGWDSPPGDAYNKSSDYRYHYTLSVYAGETCSGTGQYRSCSAIYNHIPVYDDYYFYTVDRWEFQMWLYTTGDDQNPLWAPVENEHFNSAPVIGNRALSGVRQETYNVYFKQPKRDSLRHVSTDQARWSHLSEGQSVTLHVNAQDDIRGVTWPRNP